MDWFDSQSEALPRSVPMPPFRVSDPLVLTLKRWENVEVADLLTPSSSISLRQGQHRLGTASPSP